ncbi:MAG: glutamine-hydrolyzing carbamoyl-phosphate synthase small subunit [Lachnospiraceae bacterium]|nr:glutamine-hydrolyzing carbamoyl-phosphate synthase small subunit [Lachnospiraceae bacterium]
MEKYTERKLVLKDGKTFIGKGFGSLEDKVMEIVFNTSMVGYQEIISDPSYTDQGVVMTYPLIGNYGINDDDFETETPTISGFIVRDYNDEPSNCRSTKTLSEVMQDYGIVGLFDIDTRELARHIRDIGSCLGIITDVFTTTEAALKKIENYVVPHDAVNRVSPKEKYDFVYDLSKELIPERASAGKKNHEVFHVVAIDCGMKKNILRMFVKYGCKVTVVPWNTTSEEIMALKPDGIFVSNGPADPTDVTETIKSIRELKGKCPIFGICLGHQIISLAYGAKTYKLKFGHRGGNHPVKNYLTDKIEITSQNHSYAVDLNSIDGTGLEVTHINLLDNTVEGMRCVKDMVLSVQYHPESAPGPQDSSYLFDDFIAMMKSRKEAR